MPQTPQNDPVIDELREVRYCISKRCGHDPTKLVAHYMELQEQYRDRLINSAKTPKITDLSATEQGESP
jgi:hypothetical protein